MNITDQNIINEFLNQIVKEITETGIDVSKLKIDHIAYSTNTTEEYEKTLPELLKIGNLEKEAIISNRRVAVIKLGDPISYKNHSIEAVEVLEPKEGQDALSGWEHVEFLVDDYQQLIDMYPDLNWDTKHMAREVFSRLKLTLPSKREVKFLNEPVLVSIKKEEN